mmetsp:Transcript_45725/g.126888  ORF Transcript_45725/g.126888 Transcript_45725/m.126888 type:complete len:240 (-) Transcript_45725:124-843(-)
MAHAPVKGMKTFTDTLGPHSRALEGEAWDAMKKFTYTTTSESEFFKRHARAEHRVENMADIFAMGRRHTKYLPFHAKTAPNLNREHTHYMREYGNKPKQMVDFLANKELADIFRRKKHPSDGTRISSPRTMYTATIGNPREDIVRAPRENFAPHTFGTKTTGSLGRMKEKTCSTHSFFEAPDTRENWTRRSDALVPKTSLGTLSDGVIPRSSYKEQFKESSYVLRGSGWTSTLRPRSTG